MNSPPCRHLSIFIFLTSLDPSKKPGVITWGVYSRFVKHQISEIEESKQNDPTAVSIGDIRAWQYQIEFMYFEKIYLIHNIDGIILILIGIFRRNAAYE